MNLACVLDRDAADEEKPAVSCNKYPAVVELRALVA
jgi:hypothetical protein